MSELNTAQGIFVRSVHKASDKELLDSLKTYYSASSTSEYWARNCIEREIARRLDEKRMKGE